ncbi:hypothetical protein [Streptomyces canus]|uniref:hypothetical protein n=1 Tax=Streptomyces canus TaxID=58343 RepID=UPI003868E9C1|nr:hypothetical protein OH824_14250 [Streptomyces canus]
MTAIGYASTTGDARKVNKGGDTLTGDLVLVDSTPDTDRSATSRAYVLAQVAGAGTGVASDTVVPETTFGQASTAGVATAYSRGDHSHGTPVASDSATIRTVDVRITAGNVALATSVPWAIVTSGATPLQCSIAAAVGHRVLVAPSFMRTGSGFFVDMAILASNGSISRYLGSGTSSPLSEGNPAYYPQAGSFPAATGPVKMTVQSGEVDGSGNATFALVYRGSGTETIYADAAYPFYVLLTNIGAEPS